MKKTTEFNNDQKILSLLERHMDCLNKHDLEGVLDTIHKASPVHATTRQMLSQMFASMQVENELIKGEYIGKDNTYQFFTIHQKIIKIQGPDQVRDNISISLAALRKEDNTWKIWTIMPLEIVFCDN